LIAACSTGTTSLGSYSAWSRWPLLRADWSQCTPWGFLESRDVGGERGRLEGSAPRWAAVRASVDAMRARAINAVHLSLSRSGGDLYWLATEADGTVTRLDAGGNPAPVGDPELTTAATRLAGTNGIAEQRLISEPDTYFVGSGGKLPVYRVILS